jgi:hypothetical protein
VPDRVVVQQLRVPLEIERGGFARIVVARGIELDAVARGNARGA